MKRFLFYYKKPSFLCTKLKNCPFKKCVLLETTQNRQLIKKTIWESPGIFGYIITVLMGTQGD